MNSKEKVNTNRIKSNEKKKKQRKKYMVSYEGECQRKPYIKPRFRFICGASRSYIADIERNIIGGGKTGFSISGLFSHCLILEEEAGGKLDIAR